MPASHSHSQDASTSRIPTLDGWRGVAILLVLCNHILPQSNLSFLGVDGVNIFFVLSGYLITTKLREERAQTGRISLISFYRRRFFRLMPSVWLYLAFLALTGRLYLKEALACIFFFRQFVDFGIWHGATGHFWTLSVEEDFYLLWPTLLIMLGEWWALLLGAAMVCLIGSGVVSGTPLLLMERFEIMPLMIGCLTAYLPKRQFIPARLHKTLLFASLATLALCLFTIHAQYLPLSELVLIAFAIWSTGQDVSNLVTILLDNKVISWIGTISYSLYVWQGALIVWRGGPVWYPVTRFAVPVLGASLIYLAIERPCIEFGNHLARKRTTNHILRPDPRLLGNPTNF